MSQYYIDLNLGSTVDSGTGTETDPFSVKKFLTWDYYDLINVDDVCFFRGTCEITDRDFGVKRGILKAWDKDLYGPWRIKSNAQDYGYGIFFQDGVSSVSDGIFCCIGYYVMRISIEAQNVYNCAFLNYSQTQNNGIRIWARDQQVNIYGCIFDSNYFETRLDNVTNIYIKDSSIKTTSFTRSGSSYITYANCAIQNGNLIPESYTTFVQTQLDWVPPDMPAWNAAKELFDVSMIYADVDTPPQPGETPYTGYETDLWGNIRTGIGTGFMGTTTPPVWVSNPTIVSFNQTTARVTSTIDKNGTIYGVLLAHGATTPSAVQVKAGTDSFGNPALKGSGSFTADISNYFDITSVVSDTQYDLYCVSEGEVLQASPYGPVQFNTFTSAPDWISTYPKKSTIRYSKADFLVEINMNGTAYFVVLPNGSTAPTSAQVKAGTNSLDQPVSSGYSGSVALLGNVESSLNATNLMSGNTYDVYFVAESESLQDAPVMLSIEVPKVEPINPEKPGHTFYNVVLAGKSEVDSSLPKVTSMFRNIILAKKRINKLN